MSEPTAESPPRESEAKPTCKFPGCGDLREPKKDPSAPGPAPEYCVREDHNAGTAWRAKRKAAAGAGRAGVVEEPDTDKPVTDSAADAVN
ncbi:hypothetical protein PV435_41855, partial [Streptomyces scabiei]|nr:hypothetical protein [Streptomyces scabiei]MDX3282766.1 hypothetical protein [Streptomyces scabiei]